MQYQLLLAMFNANAVNSLRAYLTHTDTSADLSCVHKGSTATQTIASQCRYDFDYQFLTILLNQHNSCVMSDGVITTKLNLDYNTMHSIVGFISAIFNTSHNALLKKKVRNHLFDFYPELLVICLRDGVDVTQLTTNCATMTSSTLCRWYSEREQQHLAKHIETLIRAANSADMLDYLLELHIREYGSTERPQTTGNNNVLALFLEAGFDEAAVELSSADGLDDEDKEAVDDDISRDKVPDTDTGSDCHYDVTSLKQYCRITIRHSVNTNVLHAAPRLGLPKPLQNYLLLLS